MNKSWTGLFKRDQVLIGPEKERSVKPEADVMVPPFLCYSAKLGNGSVDVTTAHNKFDVRLIVPIKFIVIKGELPGNAN